MHKHSSLLTGRTALVYSSANPNESGRGAEQKRELLVNEEGCFLLHRPLPVTCSSLFQTELTGVLAELLKLTLGYAAAKL